MEPLGLNQIRQLFLDFYKSKEHYVGESFSLIPKNDKSLLIINSGMAPMKPYFAGLVKPPAPRMTTCQKCVRTADIENVGYTSRHGTFFEMLGSFSFGDYFKEESIAWGWEFVNKVLNIPQDRLWVSVYVEDDEAYNIWKDQIKFPEDRIVRLGKDDNFWEIGTGPCGPCSEIYYDMGEKFGCGCEDCKPGCECDRFVEFWNHVFTQYNNEGDGTYTDLDKKNIDTGMGLERIACIMQGVDSIFEVDTLAATLSKIEEVAGVKYEKSSSKTDISIRIITDHIRAATFMIGDNIVATNEGRGYVLRRLIRRAVNHGHKLGIRGLFLDQIARTVIETSGDAYPVLKERSDYIIKSISMEEEKFRSTLEQGIKLIEDHFIKEMREKGQTVLSGPNAFKLHDTYGFPIDITEEILADAGLQVDREGFVLEMDKQKAMSKADSKTDQVAWETKSMSVEGLESQFVGYETLESAATVIALRGDGKTVENIDVNHQFQAVQIILDQTPFYPTGGGQACDKGTIEGPGWQCNVSSVEKKDKAIVHMTKDLAGSVKVGDQVNGKVDLITRNRQGANHTATHLLHSGLRKVLGSHIEQAGSNLDDKGLRFDFNHFKGLTKEEIDQVEDYVNLNISKFIPVITEEMAIEEAKAKGAVGLFESQYKDQVRVVTMGQVSMELCGGTHVGNTGLIGGFMIKSETGVAGGVRRIEAITGQGLLDELKSLKEIVEDSSAILKTNRDDLVSNIGSLKKENKEISKELAAIKKEALKDGLSDLTSQIIDLGKVKLLVSSFQDLEMDQLRQITDDMRADQPCLVQVFSNTKDGKATILVSVSDQAVDLGLNAGKIVKEIAILAGGNGGGKANMAQAGIKEISKLSVAIESAESIVKTMV